MKLVKALINIEIAVIMRAISHGKFRKCPALPRSGGEHDCLHSNAASCPDSDIPPDCELAYNPAD